jgi:hypothetical protein
LWCFYFISLALGEILKVSKLEQQKKKKAKQQSMEEEIMGPNC